MKIGICDDEEAQRLKTKAVVDSCIERLPDWIVELYDPHNLEFDVYTQRFDLDILIMDICFQSCEFDGINLARKINDKFPKCKIIFVSNYLEYAPEVYDTEHVWFVWKKNMDVMLKKAVKKVILQENEDKKPDTVEFYSDGKKVFVRQRDVMYAERVNRRIEIVTGSLTYNCCLSLTDLSKQLNEDFIRATGGCIVNLKYVRSVMGNTVELETQKKLTLGRRFETPFKEAYLAFVSKQI